MTSVALTPIFSYILLYSPMFSYILLYSPIFSYILLYSSCTFLLSLAERFRVW